MGAVQKSKWSTAGDLVRSFGFRMEAQPDKIAILNAVWEKELGYMAKHWLLLGVRKGILYVRPASSAATLELSMRAPVILSGLNKYFNKRWLKAIKTSLR